jgi:hypothetical protein
LILGSVSLALAAPAAAEIGRVKTVLGPANIERAGAVLPAASGVELLPGDALVTGAGGKITLTFVDNARFAVGPDSRILLTSFDYDPTSERGDLVTEVVKGTIAAVSGRAMKSSGRSGMQINTPDATLEVENSSVIVEVK